MSEPHCGSPNGVTFWSQNKCRRTLTFTIVDDDTEEVDERVNIVFGTYSGSFFLSSTSADITIVDNDEAPNTPPRVTTTGITVDENTERTAALERIDDEPEDLQGINWQLRTGNGDDDNDKFTFDSLGRLKFKTLPDYENPDDADRDRTYKVRVRTQTGTAARGGLWSDDAEVTVTVADVNEPPEAVTNIRRTAQANNSLTMAWNAPAATTPPDRPAVTGYDMSWKWNGVDDYPAGNLLSTTGTSLQIANLVAGSRYDVRVRAKNDEGAGDWTERDNADQTTTGTAPRRERDGERGRRDRLRRRHDDGYLHREARHAAARGRDGRCLRDRRGDGLAVRAHLYGGQLQHDADGDGDWRARRGRGRRHLDRDPGDR